MYEYGHWQYTRAEDAVEKSVNLKLPNNVTQRPTVSSMAAEAKPGWSSAPWRPKKEIRVPVVGRRPLRHQIEGKAANDDSVSDLIAQSSVGSASASSGSGSVHALIVLWMMPRTT